MTHDAKKLTPPEKIGGIFLGCIAAFFVLILLLGMLGASSGRVIFQMGEALLVGWFKFCERTLAAIEWNWPLVVFWGVCFLLVGIGLNRLLKRFSSFIAEKRGKSFIWPTRWTWSALVAVSIFFAVGMSVGGVLHQVGWMAGSKEPMMVSRARNAGFATMKQIDGAVQQALLESKEDYELARQSIWSYLKHPDTLQNKYRMFVVIGADGKVAGRVIFPLNQQEFQQTGGLVYIEGETDSGFLPMEKVKSLLQTHRDKLKQF